MTTTLSIGARSSAVTKLQQQLAKLGHYKAAIDGSYGPVTKKAVAEFEKKAGLKADGVADGHMRDALAKAVAPKPAATLKVGSSGAKVKTLQSQLKTLGYYKAAVDGSFGPVTRAAVQAFERKHGFTPDGIAGSKMQAALAKAVKTQPKASWQTVKAPPADYRVVWFRGAKVNVRTRVMIERAESYMKKMGINSRLVITQGSYSSSVSASAGTHSGGGALDISIRQYSTKNADKVVKALRMAGFAAWRRRTVEGFSPHIHAIAIGDKRASASAKSQVAAYFRGRDALRSNRPDIHLSSVGGNIGRPVPNWAK